MKGGVVVVVVAVVVAAEMQTFAVAQVSHIGKCIRMLEEVSANERAVRISGSSAGIRGKQLFSEISTRNSSNLVTLPACSGLMWLKDSGHCVRDGGLRAKQAVLKSEVRIWNELVAQH